MKKKYIVYQEETSDCGVCCLLSIIRFYGGNANLELLRLNSSTTKDGVTALNLIKCANSCGFDAEGFKTKIIKDKLPYIAHVIVDNLSHFVVVYKVNDNYVEVMDPAKGYIKVSLEVFNKQFTGEILVFYPKGKIVEYNNKHILEKQLKKQVIINKGSFIMLILLNLVLIGLSILYSFNIQILIDSFHFKTIILFTLVFILINSINIIIDYLSVKVNKNIGINILNNFVNKIFHIPLKYIHIKESSELIKRTDELDSIKNLIKECLISFILNGLIIVSILIFIGFINYSILLIIIYFIIFYPLIVILLSRRLNNRVGNLINVSTSYKNTLNNTFNGLTSIMHSNSRHYYQTINKTNIIKYSNTIYEYDKYLLLVKNTTAFIIGLFELIVNIILIIMVNNNSLLVVDIITFNLLISLITSAIISISNNLPAIILSRKLIIKINEYYDIDEKICGYKDFSYGDIVINNLSYKYNNYHQVFNDLNLTINKGDKVLLMGESGTGKSSLCRILNKEILDYSGIVTINDVNLKDINDTSLSDGISYSSQSECIFNDTIKNNIIMGKHHLEKRLDDIIKICCLDRILKKKAFGLDTLLYGGGEELSGGEKQLIILARTLINNSKIIILDEALSMVNNKVEDKIIKNIFNYYKDNIVIYISHRKCGLFKKVINMNGKE